MHGQALLEYAGRFRAAADAMDNGKWVQHAYHVPIARLGKAHWWSRPQVGMAHCTLGALEAVSANPEQRYQLRTVLERHLTGGGVIAWNDRAGQTAANVLLTLRTLAADLEDQARTQFYASKRPTQPVTVAVAELVPVMA